MLEPKDISYEQYCAICDFGKGIQDCLKTKQDVATDEKTKEIIGNIICLVEIHLLLKELDWEVVQKKMEKALENK